MATAAFMKVRELLVMLSGLAACIDSRARVMARRAGAVATQEVRRLQLRRALLLLTPLYMRVRL